MSKIKKKGLGRGLSSLFGDAKEDIESSNNQGITKLLIGDISRNEFQPRINFDEDKLLELSESIRTKGLIQPIAVRRSNDDQNKYEIIAGERRWLAAQKAGFHEVPVTIHDFTDQETLEVAIIENIQREDLNSIEEARGYERLQKEFKYEQDKIAKMMSKSRSHITNTLRLLNLSPDIIEMLEQGVLTAGQARPLIGLKNASQIAELIAQRKLSARAVEDLIRKKKNISKDNDPNIENIKNKIENALGLKVSIINKKNNSGKISIEYKNLEQFDLVADLLNRN